MIAFLCSHCGAELRVKDELAGTKGKCPRCQHIVEAPLDSSPGESAPSGAGSGARGPEKPTDPPAQLLEETIPTPAPARAAGSGSRSVFESESVHSAKDLAFLAPPRAPDELGRLGHYRILKVLGAGGMGIVFQAEDVQLKRQVALKAMKANLAAKAEDRQRFLREAQTAAAIDHEHIVTIYQVGQDRGIPFLAMKLLQGESLEDRLNSHGGRLPLPEVLRIGQEVAEGLAAAHTRGLIHRDIKPANIWLEEGRDWVRIVDFGLARVANEEGSLTLPGMIIGTPSYMAPEQANAEPVDFRCDLFSLGCVLYRASTGELPFKGKNIMAMLLALASKTPPSPHALDPSLPEAFSDLVMTLLEKNPARRSPSAQAVWDAIERIKQLIAAAGEASPPAPKRQSGTVPVAPQAHAAPPAAEEEVEELEVVEEDEEAAPSRPGGKRKSAGTRKPPKRKSARREKDDGNGERKVMILAVVVAIAIFGLIVYLIVRHVFFKPADSAARVPIPRATVTFFSDFVCPTGADGYTQRTLAEPCPATRLGQAIQGTKRGRSFFPQLFLEEPRMFDIRNLFRRVLGSHGAPPLYTC